MRTFIVHPDRGGPFPVALVFMDGVGYREQVKENARRFASHGYYCAVPDLYYRLGEITPFDFSRLTSGTPSDEERQRMMKIVSTVTPENVVADTRAVIAEVSKDSAASRGPMVCVGYCMGARVALHIAASLPEDFVAAAGIHPGALITDKPDSPHHDLRSVRGELYFAFAEIDRSATAELVDQFRDEMQRAGVRGVVERLPGVAHGFSMEDLPVYDHDAAERHFDRTLDLWRRNLSAQPVR
ncbi:MAG TPA: dienelactone hydrolase family protein [Candidatus Dormibacteraeota bacterium]|nr:dienelactone hydrolase family protein [Candidatus Dormibacteraeota bacterium]